MHVLIVDHLHPITLLNPSLSPLCFASQYRTYRQLRDECMLVAKAFTKLGLKPFQSVIVLGGNAPEWTMSYIGAMLAVSFPFCLIFSLCRQQGSSTPV
jgi:hypothetical protein